MADGETESVQSCRLKGSPSKLKRLRSKVKQAASSTAVWLCRELCELAGSNEKLSLVDSHLLGLPVVCLVAVCSRPGPAEEEICSYFQWVQEALYAFYPIELVRVWYENGTRKGST